jgi:Icc-related predicted phosphoesterase
MQPVGSTACRAVITEYEPLIGLHGHLHESKGTYNLGRTLCINPGSEYSEGILRGAIIDVDKGKVKNYILTTG